jgi:hypothetical protein
MVHYLLPSKLMLTTDFLPPYCCYILQKSTLTKVEYILKICYHTSFQYPILSSTSAAPTLQVHAPATLILPIVGN